MTKIDVHPNTGSFLAGSRGMNLAAAATPHGKRDQSKLTKMNTKLAARKKPLLSSVCVVFISGASFCFSEDGCLGSLLGFFDSKSISLH